MGPLCPKRASTILQLNAYLEYFITLMNVLFRAADGDGGTGAIYPGPHLARGPRWGLCYIIKRSKYSNEQSP